MPVFTIKVQVGVLNVIRKYPLGLPEISSEPCATSVQNQLSKQPSSIKVPGFMWKSEAKM